MEDVVLKYAGPQVKLALGVSFEQLKKSGAMYHYSLQPLTDIHLRSHLDNEIEPNSDIQYVYIFALIALGNFVDCLHKFYEPCNSTLCNESKRSWDKKNSRFNKTTINNTVYF